VNLLHDFILFGLQQHNVSEDLSRWRLVPVKRRSYLNGAEKGVGNMRAVCNANASPKQVVGSMYARVVTLAAKRLLQRWE
jgi:hypothetical protein